MKRWIPRLALLAAATLVAILFCEITVRLFFPQELQGSKYDITESGLQVNKREGSVNDQFGDRRVIYQYYEPHLRDTPLRPDANQVLVLGDSYVFGLYLDAAEIAIAHVQRLADLEFGTGVFHFLNAATGNWGTADGVAFVEEFGRTIDPEIILVVLNTDDIGRSIYKQLYVFSDEHGFQLQRRRPPVPISWQISNSIPGYDWIVQNSHLAQLSRRVAVAGARPESPELEADSEQAVRIGRALFLRLKRWCDDNGVELLVTTTGWHKTDKGHNLAPLTDAFMSHAEKFFASEGIPYEDISKDLYTIFTMDLDSYIITGDGHPNEKANRLMAEHQWRFLKERLRRRQPAIDSRTDQGAFSAPRP